MSSRIYPFFLLLLGLVSCDTAPRRYILATGSNDGRHYRVGKDIQELIKAKSIYQFTLDTLGAGSISNCDRLMKGKADLALAQNDVPIANSTGDLRTMLPLYPQLFFILYADSLKPSSLRELIVGRNIAIGPKSGGTANFAQHFLELMGIDASEYTLVYTSYKENTVSERTPVSITVTAFNNERIIQMLAENKAKIWSLDDPENLGKGSLVEGFCMQYPYARPFIIPRNTFQTHPEQPVLTLALDNVLLVHKSVDKHVVFDLVGTILGNKEILVQKDALYNFIHDDFDKESLQFPLHEGVKDYLDRHQPSFYERYADLLALSLTLTTILVGGISTLISWNKRRKKERIDQYYQKVIQIENKLKNSQNISELHQGIEGLNQLRQKAFAQLMNEKLQADDSFRIFITLIQDVIAVIQDRMERLKSS
ncbi:MAG: TAXI family TRAP transporter solute-binding subunit [Microscillaceae bacterium]|nr:TAXI family TRAP transporter solute-binding subunit [Microscillaceae bacterium]